MQLFVCTLVSRLWEVEGEVWGLELVKGQAVGEEALLEQQRKIHMPEH